MEVQSVWWETPLWFIAALVTWKQFSFFLQIWKTSNFTSNFMNMFVLPPLICIKWFCRFTFPSFKCFGFLVRSSHHYYSSWLFSSSNFTLFLHFFLIIICHWPDVPFVGGLVDVVKKVPKTADDPKACSPNGLEFKALHFTTGVCPATLVDSADEPRCSHGGKLKKSAHLKFFSAWSWIISPLWRELGGLGCVLLCAPWL